MKSPIALLTLVVLFLSFHTTTAQQPLVIKGLDEAAPVKLEAQRAEDALILSISVKKDWHLYARDVGGGQPVTISLDKSCADLAAGPLEIPASADGKLRGDFNLRLPLKAADKAKPLAATFDFMACDPLMCLPPMSVSITEEPNGLRVLYVAGKFEDREEGIAKFLTDRGFKVTKAPYAGLTANECEKHDVVLADSMVFRKFKAKRADVMAFPKSSTPLVAVGFWGTELIEKHGLAMTAGYI